MDNIREEPGVVFRAKVALAGVRKGIVAELSAATASTPARSHAWKKTVVDGVGLLCGKGMGDASHTAAGDDARLASGS